MSENVVHGMTSTQAKRLEMGIIWFCVLAVACIFQPFSQALFSAGCIGVVIGGLAFNLVPVCVAGKSLKDVGKVALIVAIVFVVVVILALASAWAYGLYLGK